MANKSIFNWSGGKDSALALYHVLQDKNYQVERLLTNVNATYNRIAMHGVRVELLQQQPIELKLPLQELRMNDQPTMSAYNDAMASTMKALQTEGFTHSIFGDIFLEDLKKYREDRLAEVGFSAYFPLWKKDSTQLMHEFIDLGFKTIVCCIKSDLLDESFAGRIIDKDFLKDLPKGIDPCGENGEFHTFVFDGPIFSKPIPITIGEKVLRQYEAPKNKEDNCFSDDRPRPTNMGFWFCDLLLDTL